MEAGVTGEFVFAGGGGFDESLDDRVGGHALALGGEADHDPVPQHRRGEGLDVFHSHVAAALEQGPGLAAEDEELHGPWPGAPGELVRHEVGHALLAGPRLPHQRQRITDEMIAHGHLPHALLQRDDVGRREHGPGLLDDRACRAAGDLEFLLKRRVVHPHLEHEAILLCFRQRIGALLLDRVLRGEHEEGIDEPVPHAADAHLPLLHRLQERGLRLGGRAVDLVGEHDVGEEGAFEEPQLPRAAGAVLLEHVGADDVGRHQVGRELDATEGEIEALGERADHERLRQPGHAFQQAMAAAEEADEQFLHHLMLPHDHAGELLEDSIVGLVKPLHRGGVDRVRMRHECSGRTGGTGTEPWRSSGGHTHR